MQRVKSCIRAKNRVTARITLNTMTIATSTPTTLTTKSMLILSRVKGDLRTDTRSNRVSRRSVIKRIITKAIATTALLTKQNLGGFLTSGTTRSNTDSQVLSSTKGTVCRNSQLLPGGRFTVSNIGYTASSLKRLCHINSSLIPGVDCRVGKCGCIASTVNEIRSTRNFLRLGARRNHLAVGSAVRSVKGKFRRLFSRENRLVTSQFGKSGNLRGVITVNNRIGRGPVRRSDGGTPVL